MEELTQTYCSRNRAMSCGEMTAPVEFVRSVTVKRTFVRRFPPARTLTWNDSYSPRAAHNCAFTSLPGASCGPTRDRLGATQTVGPAPAPRSEEVSKNMQN